MPSSFWNSEIECGIERNVVNTKETRSNSSVTFIQVALYLIQISAYDEKKRSVSPVYDFVILVFHEGALPTVRKKKKAEGKRQLSIKAELKECRVT
jgi:hypothetical protein